MQLIIATREDINIEIMKSASYSSTGYMIYRKWNKKQRRFEKKRYEVVPIDCGYSSRNNKILYAQDYKDHSQIKMFIINQIQKFQYSKKKVRTSFPIQIKNLQRFFGNLNQDELNDEESR